MTLQPLTLNPITPCMASGSGLPTWDHFFFEFSSPKLLRDFWGSSNTMHEYAHAMLSAKLRKLIEGPVFL